MDIEEKAPLLDSSNGSKASDLRGQSKRAIVVKRIGQEAKGFLGLQGNKTEDGKVSGIDSLSSHIRS